eukprot:4351174-Pyramimonas_sp.AAC.1
MDGLMSLLRWGALAHAYPKVLEMHYEGLMVDAKLRARFFSWVSSRIASRDGGSDRPCRAIRHTSGRAPQVGLNGA